MQQLSILKAIFLGALQGATEFLPVSSSGHLVIAQSLLNVQLDESSMLAFDVCLHVGTLVAIVAVFWRDIRDIVMSYFKNSEVDELSQENLPPSHLTITQARKLGLYLVIGTIPAVIFGLSFKHFFEKLFSSPMAAGAMLMITGLILFGTRFADGREVRLGHMKWWRSLGVGIAQAVAIIPGISRSGSTIAGGLYLGLDRNLAARFAFLLAVPAIGGAAVLEYKSFMHLSSDIMAAAGIGTLVSAIVGFVCVKWMLGIVRRGRLSWFAYYCWFAGILTMVVLHMKGV